MRFVVVLAALGCLISQVGYGEDSSLNFGVQGSLNFASSNNSQLVDDTFRYLGANQTSRTGIMLGINLEAALSPYIYLQPELMYTQKGFGLEAAGYSGYGDGGYGGSKPKATVTADYISTALLLKVKPIPHSQIRPYIYGGPEFGVNVSEGGEVVSSSGRARSTTIVPIADFDFAIDMGAGIEASVAERVSIYTDFRYSMGLMNIYDNPPVAGAEIKTSTFQAIAGVRIAM